MYLQCPSNKSRTTVVLFYALCLLYVLSAVTFVSDIVALIFSVSKNLICKNIIFLLSCAVAYQGTIASTSN